MICISLRFLYENWHRSVAVKASVFDPSFKGLTFIEHANQVTEVYNAVKEELRHSVIASHESDEANHQEEPADPQDEDEDEALRFMHQFAGQADSSYSMDIMEQSPTQAVDQQTKVELAMQQFRLYLAMPSETAKRSPLHFWKQHAIRFHLLIPLVRKYLSIPSTSAPAESIFSTTGYITRKARQNLTPEHVNQLTFNNRNYHILGQ